MRKLIGILSVLVAVIVVALVLRGRGGPGEEGPKELRFTGLWEEAFVPADPARLGPAWPTDTEFAVMRQEWSALGAEDSLLVEHLVQDWIYAENRGAYRMTSATQLVHGDEMTLEQRLELGEQFLAHPNWRVGGMRHVPAVAAVLSPLEKSLIQYLGRDGHLEPHSVQEMATTLKLPAEDLARAAGELADVGWLVASGPADSAAYALRDTGVIEGGAMVYLTYSPSHGRTHDVVSLATVLKREAEEFNEGRVRLFGPCAQTGRTVEIEIAMGKLRSGKPGKAYAVELMTPGLSNGLFASEPAFRLWKQRHPNVEVAQENKVPAFYHAMMAES